MNYVNSVYHILFITDMFQPLSQSSSEQFARLHRVQKNINMHK